MEPIALTARTLTGPAFHHSEPLLGTKCSMWTPCLTRAATLVSFSLSAARRVPEHGRGGCPWGNGDCSEQNAGLRMILKAIYITCAAWASGTTLVMLVYLGQELGVTRLSDGAFLIIGLTEDVCAVALRGASC